ncbi:MAG: hypothetical protein ACM3NQ_05085, partial [Bacteroidales bacterium]
MIVTASAPIRVCDCGGWTDTWFAGHGRVLNIAVRPRALVRVATFPARPDRPRVVIDAVDFGDRYVPRFIPGQWDRHPLLEAAIARCDPPDDVAVEISIRCGAPAGAGTGTSAAVTVALVGALATLRGERMTADELARAAHAVETENLGRQSGIQDQICSAYGGINDIRMREYPRGEVRRLQLSASVLAELERRLVLVFVGRSHRSSEIHQRVIAWLTGRGAHCAQLEDLRLAAQHSATALDAGDLTAFGAAMVENTEAQRRLHPDLVCPDARRIIDVARQCGAAGWKVNGAGGDGGSLTLLGPPDPDAMSEMRRAIKTRCGGAEEVP